MREAPTRLVQSAVPQEFRKPSDFRSSNHPRDTFGHTTLLPRVVGAGPRKTEVILWELGQELGARTTTVQPSCWFEKSSPTRDTNFLWGRPLAASRISSTHAAIACCP